MKFRAWLTLAFLSLNVLAPGFVDPATIVNPGGGSVGTAPTTAPTSTVGYGKAWATAANGPNLLYYLDDTNVQGFGEAGATAISLYNSTDAGRSYTLTKTISGFPADTFGGKRQVLKSALGTVMVITASAGAGTRGFIRTTNPTGAASAWQTVITGLTTNSSAFGIAQSANGTIVITRTAGGVGQTCRSTDDGLTFTCTNFGAGGHNVNGIISPSSGVFLLAYDGSFWKSTNDGVSFSIVLTPAGGINGLGCLSSLICLGASGGAGAPVLQRSTDGGSTWTSITTFDMASWGGFIQFVNFGGGIVVIPRTQTVTAVSAGVRSTDFGLTWTALLPYPQVPGGANPQAYQSVSVRGGNAVAVHVADTSSNPVYSIALLPGQVGIVQQDPINSISMSPVQGATIFNAQTTGAANTAVVVTLPASAGQRYHLYRIEASCAAGASNLTVTDGGTTIWSSLANEVGVARFRQAFVPAALTGVANSAMVITLAACGAGNAGTLITHADRF